LVLQWYGTRYPFKDDRRSAKYASSLTDALLNLTYCSGSILIIVESIGSVLVSSTASDSVLILRVSALCPIESSLP